MARPKNPSNQINSYDEELAKFAQAAAAEKAAAAGSTNRVSLKAGLINVGGTVVGTSAPIVVLSDVPTNTYYEGAYDPADPQGPTCFAFGVGDEPMKPHKDSLKPQHTDCANCPHNKFGSAIGRDGKPAAGKACKNTTRMVGLVGTYKDGKPVLGDLGTAPLWQVSLPPTSVRNWAAFVVASANLVKRPPFGFVTNLHTVPDQKAQFLVQFAHERNLTADEYAAIKPRLDEAKELALAPFITVARDPKSAAPAPTKGRKQKYA